MNILFLNKNFYEYDSRIKNELEKNGHNVDSFCITRELSLGEKIYERFFHKLNREKIDLEYQYKLLDVIFQKEYDLIFVLAGQGLRKQTVEKLIRRYPKANLCWYIWDSVQNLNTYEDIKSYFHTIILFDKFESSQLNLKYLPLFYTTNVCNTNKTYDVSMIGQDRSYRRRVLKDVANAMTINNSFIYLKTGRFEKIKSWLKRDKELYHWLNTKSLTYEKTCEVMRKSKIVIDIPAPNQTGLTMRTIETIGFHTKMITTNATVKFYDFYNDNNILVVDPDNIIVPQSFLDSEYCEIPMEIFESYSLENWCKKLLEYIS